MPDRLQVRFRVAALLLLLPLIALAAVSGVGLVVNARLSSVLEHAEQEHNQVDTLLQDVQDSELAGTALLTDRAADDLATMTAAEAQFQRDMSSLQAELNRPADQATELNAALYSWQQSSAARLAVKAIIGSTLTATQGAPLEDELSRVLGDVIAQLRSVQSLQTDAVNALQAQQHATELTSAVAIALALSLGLIGALWLSRRLARSILVPISDLRIASERLSAGDLSHRLVVDSKDEIAGLGLAFNSMADQLDERAETVRHRERRLVALVENATDGILVMSGSGGIIFATPTFASDFTDEKGATPQLAEIVHPDDLERTQKAWARVLAGDDGATSEVEARIRRTDGEWRHVWARMTNRLLDPAVAGVVLNLSDVSERYEHAAQLSYHAFHDALTGLANRELFREKLLRASRDGHRTYSVLYLGFDDFKLVNDSLGRAAGDDFLRSMSQRLVSCVRPDDIVARLGGDEFAILLDGAGDAEAVAASARVLTALAQAYPAGLKELHTSASVGIATGVAGATSAETLLADADLAMHVAKRKGKGCHQVFTETMRSELLDRLQLGEDLRSAVDSDAISVHYQPVVDMETGRIVGAEALARWEHPSRGWVGPFIFIPLAEEIGLVERIDAAVLRRACLQGRVWADAGLPRLRIAVNLSGRDLAQPELVDRVAATLAETGFAAADLELELTEGVAIAEPAGAQSTLTRLKELGLHLAIDDFGTGYSALARLRSLPFDRLKIDKSFVDELPPADERPTLVDSILDMARVLGLQVVAEGVETEAQADFLRRRRCDFAQGYLFSRPLPPEAFAALCAERRSLAPRPPLVAPGV